MPELELPPEYPWYALFVKPRHEKAVSEALQGKGYPQFLPLYRKQRQSAGHTRVSHLPLFPTYLFCRLNPQERLPVLMIPGVFSIVGCGKIPVPVEPSEIEAIRRVTESGLDLMPWPYLQAGQTVRIVHGPLRELHGWVVEIKKQFRLVVSVTLLQRSVAVEVNREWIVPASPASEMNGGNDLRRRAS